MRNFLLSMMLLLPSGLSASADNVFKYAFQSDLDNLDPQYYTTFQIGVLSHVYEPLVARDSDLGLKPALATSWRRLSETEWEFNLRKGVKFHGGEDFTGEDVAFTIKRGEKTRISATSNRIKDVEIITPHKIIIRTYEPYALLESELPSILIMDKGWTINNKADDYSVGGDKLITATKANGTGPFKVASRQAGVKTEFVRWKKHWNSNIKTNIDRIIFTPIEKNSTRVAALLSGAIDFAYPIPIQDQKRLDDAEDIKLLTGPETRTIFLGLDQWRNELPGSDVKGKNPFKDIRVRQAFSHAINTDLIHKKVMRGASYPTGTMVAQYAGYPGDDIAQPYPYNLSMAKSLLASAGYPNGFKVILDCPNNRYVNDEKICQAIVSLLGKINVKVKLNTQPKSKFFAKVLSSGGYNSSFYLLGLSPGALNAMSTAEFALACRDKVAGMGTANIGNYCNLENHELLVKANQELDNDKRQILLRKVFENTKKDVGYLPLHNQALSWGVNDKFIINQRSDNVLVWDNIVKK